MTKPTELTETQPGGIHERVHTETHYRAAQFDRAGVDEENRTAELAFSSEEPVERYFGTEVLDHARASVRLGRMQDAGPLLVDHDGRDHVGVVESVTIDTDKRGRAVVRFGRGERASEIFNDVLDGIRSKVSVGYRIHGYTVEKGSESQPDLYRVNDWEPLEISLVSVPADATVGVARDLPAAPEKQTPENQKQANQPIQTDQRGTKMSDPIETPAGSSATTAEPVVDVRAIESAARNGELQRIRDIQTLGDRHGQQDLARQFTENGQSLDQFRGAVLSSMGAAPVVDTDASVGLSERDLKDYSFVRAINALANPTDRRAQEAAAFEFECSAAAAGKTRKQPQGILVPDDVLRHSQRDLSVGTTTAGGHTVATDLLGGSFIELLRNSMALVDAGATVLEGLVGDIAIPRQTGGATAYWVAEAAAVTESQQAFDQVALAPSTLGGMTDYSRKLLLQSSIGIEQFVRNDLATVIALELDRAGINGSGSGAEPTGILGTSGIGDTAGGTNGLAPAWAHVVDIKSDVAVANAKRGSLRWLLNSATIGKLEKTEKASSTAQFLYDEGTGRLAGFPVIESNQVPSNISKGTGSNLSALLFGNFADLIIGMWGGLDLLVDPYTGGASGTVRVIAHQDVDVAVRHAASFSAMQDAITT